MNKQEYIVKHCFHNSDDCDNVCFDSSIMTEKELKSYIGFIRYILYKRKLLEGCELRIDYNENSRHPRFDIITRK